MKSQNKVKNLLLMQLLLPMLILLMSSVSDAVPPVREFSATISPTTAYAGVAETFTITITNDATSTKEIGSAKVTVPTGFTVDGATVAVTAYPFGKDWQAVLVAGEIMLDPKTPGVGGKKLDAGESVSVAFSATAGTSGTYEWTTIAYSGTDWMDANFSITGTQPTVEVIAALGSISGAKFYDADTDGLWDVDEPAIEGWMIHLIGDTVDEYTFTDADGEFIFEDLEPGSYTVEEVFPPTPPNPTWVPTTDTSFSHDLEAGEDYVGPDFGNVCLEPGYGGHTKGYWRSKNGQGEIISDDITILNGLNLYVPAGYTYPPFSTTLETAKEQIANYLQKATAVDMRWMLSAQLIATELNVLHGYLDGTTIVYVGSSSYVPSGFIQIDEIMDNANAALLLPHPDNRDEQEYWKDLLDGLNNNLLPFVCSEPCLPIIYLYL